MGSPLGLELRRVVSCHVGARNPVQVIWKSSQGFLAGEVSHFSSSNYDNDGDDDVHLKVQVSVWK